MADATTDPALVPADTTEIVTETVPVAPAPAAGNNNSTSSTVGTPNKDRHSLTLDQRRALRRWAKSQTVRPSHKACIDWFYSHYGTHISQSTVSHSLSPKYSRLDGDQPQLSGSRLRLGNWPDVEKLVLRWYQQVQNTGRQPTNEELGEKAKSVFAQLPRYKEETPPEFSPGWIHRFKKRYGLLIRRQRRTNDSTNPAEDIDYLVDTIPRIMELAPDTSASAIRENVLRVIGIDAKLNACALARDEALRRMNAPHDAMPPTVPMPPEEHSLPPQQDQPMYGDDDPEVVLQNALRQLQQEEQAAEEQAAAVREERERQERENHGLPPPNPLEQTTPNGRASSDPRYGTPAHEIAHDLTLTPIHSEGPMATNERPIRCPFCVNQRMLRTIKEAVEHLSTHVVV